MFSKWHPSLGFLWNDLILKERLEQRGLWETDCEIAPSLVLPRWGSLRDQSAGKDHVPLTSVLLIDYQGIFSYRSGREDGVSLPCTICISLFQRCVEYVWHTGRAVALAEQSSPALPWKHLLYTRREDIRALWGEFLTWLSNVCKAMFHRASYLQIHGEAFSVTLLRTLPLVRQLREEAKRMTLWF